MYFDTGPKNNLDDFYNYRDKLEELCDFIAKGRRMVVIEGLRRTGKTSLLRTALNWKNLDHLSLDGRDITRLTSNGFLAFVTERLNGFLSENKSWRERALDVLRGVQGFKVSPQPPFIAEIEWRRGHEVAAPDIGGLLAALGKGNPQKSLVLAFDEAQILGEIKGYDFRRLFRSIYDNAPKNVVLVFSGSEVGLLHNFLGLTDSQGQTLFDGRAYTPLRLEPLNQEKRVEFLAKGLDQISKKLDDATIEKLAEEVGGIMGWLTIAGDQIRTREGADVQEIVSEAAKLAAGELNKFLAGRQKARRFNFFILSNLTGPRNEAIHLTIPEVKRFVENDMKRTIGSESLSESLKDLVDFGFVSVDGNSAYYIPDPMYRHPMRLGMIRS